MKEIKFPIKLRTAGVTKDFFIDATTAQCGPITNGVAFRFDGEGGWVVDKKQLINILRFRPNRKPKKAKKVKK